MDFLSGLIGAGANLLGGLFGRSSAEKVAQQNIAAQEEFAQHGISWRVADARAAGINPLAALGATTNSFSNIVGDNSLGAGVSAAGQDLSRAAAANSSRVLRQADLEAKLVEAKIRNTDADTVATMARASQLARTYGGAGSPTGIDYTPSDLSGGPIADPRPHKGMIPLLQSGYDPRTGETYSIPSAQAASPLQTLGAMPVNIGIIGRSSGEMFDYGNFGPGFARPDVYRNVNPASLQAMY